MLKRVDPLRKELNDLEREAEVTRLKGVEINKVVKELEESIAGWVWSMCINNNNNNNVIN